MDRYFTVQESGGRRAALAATVLTSLGLGRRLRDELDGQVDRELLAQVVRYDSPHLAPGSSLGIVRTLLHQSMSVTALGRGADSLERADLLELNTFARFEHATRNPEVRDVVGTAAMDGAVWLDIGGGLPEIGWGKKGSRRLSLFVAEAAENKVLTVNPEKTEMTDEGPRVMQRWIEPEKLLARSDHTLLLMASHVIEPVSSLNVRG